MDYSAIQTLETAAQMLMAPPNIVTSEQRHQAESVFLEFRSTKNPYELCREILEKSSSDYVLFEAASLIKTALIREWNLLSDNDISSLREYLLNYLLRKDTPKFLKEKLLQTIAVIIKRGSITDSGRERKALLDELEKIILSSTINHQQLACSLILAIMQEYAITVKSADVGLVWEVHFRLKKSFEALDLKRIFRFTVGVLEQIVRSGHRPQGEQALLTKQLLTIVEMVLCWSHVSPMLSKRLTGAFEAIYESDNAPALRLSLNWRDTIMQPELIALFFEIHMYVRSNAELANPSLTCLVQLASLSGMVVSATQLKQQYFENYVNSFMRMLAFIQPFDKEMLGISDIYRRLVQFFTPPMIAATPPAFLQNLTSYTGHCIRGAIIEESMNDDETVWRTSLNKFLHTWSSIVQDSDGFSDETLVNYCVEIFNTYLQCRLAPPDGTSLEGQLQLVHMGKMNVANMGDQLVPLFEDLHWILMITGHFLAYDCIEGETVKIPPEIVQYSISQNGNVEASLRYLVGESTNTENVDAVFKLIGEVLRISAWECAALEAGLGSVFSPELSATISWLLKIWANSYLLPQTTENSEILEVSFGRGSRGAAWVTAAAARRAAHVLRHLSAQPTPASHAVSLLATLAHSHHRESPLASSEEFLALVAWEAAGSNLSGEIRKELHRTFAIAATYAEGEVRNRLLTSTMALQEKLIQILNSELDTEPVRNALADTLDCFTGVTEGVLEVGTLDQQFLMLIAALEKVPGIVYKYHNYPAVVLPALNFLAKSAKRMLHSVHTDNADKFLEICNTTFEVYMRWNSGKISSIPHDAEEEAYEDICALMEVVCCVSRSGCGGGAAATCARGLRTLLPLVTPPLLALPTLAHRAYRMIRDLDAADQRMRRQRGGDMRARPAHAAAARDAAAAGVADARALRLPHDPRPRRRRPGTVVAAVSLYGGSVSRSGCGGGAAATCARGLRTLLPLVTPPLLALPTLAHRAYRMIRDLDAADQLTILPIEDFNMVITALRVGLTAVSCDVSTLCCDTIVGLSNKVRSFGTDNPYAISLLTLAELLLMLIIKMEIPPDSIPAAGAAIYALTCVKPALLEGLARQLIEAFAANDPANVHRLEEAFGVLTNGVLFDGYRTHKLRFQDNFDKFLASVHGFLIVK